MKQLKVFLIRCLLLFYLSSSYLSVVHFHNKTFNPNSECKICIIVKNLNSGDTPTVEFSSWVYTHLYAPILFTFKKAKKYILKGFNANAPPLS